MTDLWASTGSLKAYVIYDETKAVLAKSSAPSATGLVSYVLASKDLPQGAYYMRCSQNSLNPSRIELFFESGGIKPRIEDLEHTTEELSAKIDAIGTEDAEEIGVIRGERKNVMTDFTTFSAQHLNTNTGQLAASKAFTTSAFVEIEGGERYCIGIWKDAYGGYYADTMQEICYYDENKNLVGAETSIEVITAPSAAKYMRFSVLSKSSSIGEKGLDDMSLCEIVKGAEPVSVFDQDVFADVMPKSGLLGKKWLVMGDSNTEHNARAAAKYDEFIAAYTGVVPTNIGKSGGGFRVYGNTAMQFLTKLNSFASDNADYMPDFITIMGGSNDIVYDFENVGTIDDTTDATIFGCIHILRTRLAELYPLVPMAMISVFPHAYSAEKDMTNLVTFNTMLKEYCEKYNVPLLDLYTCSGIRPTEAAFNKKYFSSPASPDGDGLHLNYKGQKLISPRIREFILSYFGEL